MADEETNRRVNALLAVGFPVHDPPMRPSASIFAPTMPLWCEAWFVGADFVLEWTHA